MKIDFQKLNPFACPPEKAYILGANNTVIGSIDQHNIGKWQFLTMDGGEVFRCEDWSDAIARINEYAWKVAQYN